MAGLPVTPMAAWAFAPKPNLPFPRLKSALHHVDSTPSGHAIHSD